MKEDLKKKRTASEKEEKLQDWAKTPKDVLPKKAPKNVPKKAEKFEVVEEKIVEEKNITIKQQDKRSWYILKKVIGIAVDLVLYPLIIMSLLTSMISITARDSTQVRGIFGYSVVTILSGSMKAGGFEVGDVVFLKDEKPENITTSIVENAGQENQSVLQLGDVIAFYRYSVGAPSKNSLTKLQPGEELPEIDENVEEIYNSSIKNSAIKNKSEVIFHRVVAIYMAVDGTYFFETRGDSNGIVKEEIDGETVEKEDWTKGIDTSLVSEHLIVGKYIKAPEFVTSALTYMITPDGMFWIIIVPLAVIVFLQIIELMTIVFDMATEKKVLEGSLEFDSEESIKAKVGKEMSEYNKIYFYDISPQEQKHRVRHFLWEEGFEKNPRKEARIQNNVEKSIKLYKENRDSYWEFWIENARSKSMKSKLAKLQRNANIIVKTRMLQNKKN